MDGKWGKFGALALLFGLVVGCRTMPPDVKPPETQEALTEPPAEARYNAPGMPKQAFNRDDPTKRYRDLSNNAIMPAGGSFGGPGGTMR
jgi:hypothetical protein